MVDVTRSDAVSPLAAADRHAGREKGESEGRREPGARSLRTPRQIRDVAQVMGIPETELTPRVREALAIVVSEFDRARAEAEYEREKVQRLAEEADRHPVVPLANRRGFLRSLAALLSRMAQNRMPSTLICLRLAGLDALRRERGLATADGARGVAAEALAAGVRASDLAACLGGGDFAVVLALSDRAEAEPKARALVAAVETALAGSGAHAGPVEWGLSAFAAGADAETLLAAADADLRARRATPEEQTEDGVRR